MEHFLIRTQASVYMKPEAVHVGHKQWMGSGWTVIYKTSYDLLVSSSGSEVKKINKKMLVLQRVLLPIFIVNVLFHRSVGLQNYQRH